MTLHPPVVPPPRPPRRSRHRGLAWLAGVIAAFAVVGGAFVAVNSYLSSAQPADVATSYFRALAHDDAARALSFGPVPSGDRSFLTDEVLDDQLGVGAITNFQVLTVNKAGDSAKVNVSYQLRGTPADTGADRDVTDTVPMIRKDRHWWLATSAVRTSVSLAHADQRATFAGAAIPSSPVLLFPGALPIKFDTPNLAIGSERATVQFTGSGNTALTVTATAAGINAARTAVGAALAACLAGTAKDVFCPVPGNGSSTLRAVPDSLRGTLATNAVDGLAVTVTDPTGVLVASGTVQVNGTYQSLSYANVASAVTDAKISVSVSARCYASSPASVSWVTS